MREAGKSATIVTGSPRDTQALGRVLAPLLRPGDVLLLSGDLGAGKTQLVKGIAAGLGVSELVTSPTFNIMLIHRGRLALYHVDLYRLERAEQLEDIDYFGTLEADGVTVVEWGTRFPGTAPTDHIEVELHITGDDTRRLDVEPIGDRSSSLVRAWVAACRALEGVTVVSEVAS